MPRRETHEIETTINHKPKTNQGTRPDILLIMPDQMRGDCLSILGHPAVRTPSMDRLARDGVLFRRAYTPVASCIPARYALLTGLHPQTSGVVGYAEKPFSTPSLPGLLAEAGYATVLAGRNMHQAPESGDCGYLRSAQAGYFGLIEHLDDRIASLIRDFRARSEQAGRAWVIVVTSDHGEMLGDHGYFRKCQPYEGSANIPLIISGSPELGFKSGRRVQQPVCLEDLMPTLLALAGADRPDHADGVDLTPVLRGQEQPLRPWLHFEHAPCYSQEQAFQALTDGRFKYIWRPMDGQEQLFDLDNDPREEQDLARGNAHDDVLAQWRQRLTERLAERPEGFSKSGVIVPGRPYKAINQGAMQ